MAVKKTIKYFNWLVLLLLTVSVINYPNPFNPKGGEIETFECTAGSTSEGTLYLYDMLGRLLLQKNFNLSGAGASRTTWDGYNYFNEKVGNGIYLYQVFENHKTRIGKGKIWVINQ